MIFARVLLNNKIASLTIEYEQDKITLNNLGEDLPRFLRIWRNKRRAEASFDRVKWSELDKDESEELQIYHLLDPRFILPEVKVEKPLKIVHPYILIDCSLNIEELDLPESVIHYLKEEGAQIRWIRLCSKNNQLVYMSQQDFPPYTDTVTLIFNFLPWAFPFHLPFL
jgi:hypothetical protein